MLPLAFEEQMRRELGVEYPAFEAALQQQAPVSIRLNPLKTPENSALLPESTDSVPWHPDGRYLSHRPVFTLDPLHHAGAYYVQEASSMLLHAALTQTVDNDKPLKILDLCAAPGGKSTLLQSWLHAGIVVANEVIRTRVPVLKENIERWGKSAVAIINAEAEDLAKLEDWFDVVVTDAPCSGEGLFRKDPDAIKEWSPDHVNLCWARQRRILSAAVAALAPGGTLIYSTCTYNRLENEDNIAWLCAIFGLQKAPLTLPAEWGMVENDGGYHCYPHLVRGEGLFIAVLKKDAGEPLKHSIPAHYRSLQSVQKTLVPELSRWIGRAQQYAYYQTPNGEILALPTDLEPTYLLLDKYLKNKWFGCMIGEFKGKDFIPSHALALSELLHPDIKRLELTKEEALLYLKKEVFDLPPAAPTGWVVVTYSGLPLGWIKALPNRMNNYLPVERRIRMRID